MSEREEDLQDRRRKEESIHSQIIVVSFSHCVLSLGSVQVCRSGGNQSQLTNSPQSLMKTLDYDVRYAI